MLCNLCNRRITQAAKYVTCSICHCNYHRLCIPGVDKYDEFYNGDAMTDWICIVCNNAIFPYNHIEDNDKFVSCLSENWIVTLNLESVTSFTSHPLSVVYCKRSRWRTKNVFYSAIII